MAITTLVLGLVVLLGSHSIHLVAPGWQAARRERLGQRRWRLIYSVVSLAGLALVVWGYAMARHHPVLLWAPPPGMRHLTAFLVLVAFILLAAGDVPRNSIKAGLRQPTIVGVLVWAAAHLLVNGMLADLILFGSFLAWAVLDLVVTRRREAVAGETHPAGTLRGNVAVVVSGAAIWALVAFWLHEWLIGVRPIP
jgi:uncharacterized membrane protein